MLSNQAVTNEKPRDLAVTKPQGTQSKKYLVSNNSTTLRDSKSRYEKGMELYRDGKVKVGTNGLFKVSGYYEADTEKMSCTCPDYKTRKEACKHLFAAMLFVKNRGRSVIQDLDGHTWVDEMIDMQPEAKDKVSHAEPSNPSQQIEQGNSKPLDRQSTITRLAVLNTATEILKTHRKPIEFNDIVSRVAQLEKMGVR